MLLSSFVLVGCGGSDSDHQTVRQPDEHTGTNPEPNQPDSEVKTLTEEQKVQLSQQFSGILLRETFVQGAIDTVMNSIEELLDGEAKCDTGTVKKTGNSYTFDQCVGVFEQADGASANGVVIVTNQGYEAKNLMLSYKNGDQQTLNGVIKVQENGMQTTLLADNFKVNLNKFGNAQEKTNETYSFSQYKLIWTKLDAKTVKLQSQGKLNSVGSIYGDYNVTFDNFETPFLISIDLDENLVGYPSSGTITFIDASHAINTQITAVNNTAQVKVTDQGKVISDQLVEWNKLFNF